MRRPDCFYLDISGASHQLLYPMLLACDVLPDATKRLHATTARSLLRPDGFLFDFMLLDYQLLFLM